MVPPSPPSSRPHAADSRVRVRTAALCALVCAAAAALRRARSVAHRLCRARTRMHCAGIVRLNAHCCNRRLARVPSRARYCSRRCARAQRQGDARAAIPCMSAMRKLPRHPPILCGRAALQGPPPLPPGRTRCRRARPHAAAVPAPARARAHTNARVASVPGSSTRSPVVTSDIVIN